MQLASPEKLLQRMRNNPRSVRFAEAERLLWAHGWVRERVRGSYHLYKHPAQGGDLVIVRRHGREPFLAPRTVGVILDAVDPGEESPT